MITLKKNKMYKTERGFIILRSGFTNPTGLKYCVVQEIITDEANTHYETRHTTKSIKELKETLNLEEKGAIKII